jgi:hypothetical protein
VILKSCVLWIYFSQCAYVILKSYVWEFIFPIVRDFISLQVCETRIRCWASNVSLQICHGYVSNYFSRNFAKGGDC